MKFFESGGIFGKKGQFTLTFNWIYVLIVGAVILLFFVGLAVKQTEVSEQQLTFDVTQILDSIFTGATVSEKTKNFIDTSALLDFSLTFECELDAGGGFRDIFSGYGLEGTSSSIETPIEAIFAPEEIQSNEVITWSLPYYLPFKVMDVLLLSSRNIQYYVLGGEGTDFRIEMENITEGFNIAFIDSLDEVESGDNFHVRVVEFSSGGVGDSLVSGGAVPGSLLMLADSQVSGVSLTPSNGAFYFSKQGGVWQKDHIEEVAIVSLDGERDAAKYAALFSGSAETYQCNMMKVFKRLEIVSQVYLSKYEELLEYYDVTGTSLVDPSLKSLCSNILDGDISLQQLSSAATVCTISGYTECVELENFAFDLAAINERLDERGCVTLY